MIDGTNTVGRIVYENRNVKIADWSNKFITQADKYRAQYETPYVMIVSRAFPKGKKDFCVAQQIPVVCPRMAVALASVMQEGIVAIGRLRLSGVGRDEKAHDLFQYLVSDKFEARFRGIADSVDSLRQQQKRNETGTRTHGRRSRRCTTESTRITEKSMVNWRRFSPQGAR